MDEVGSSAISQPIAIVDDTRFDAHHDGSGSHPECPERLAAAREGLSLGLKDAARTQVPVREVTADELARVHSLHYVERLTTRLGNGYGHLDPDTYYSPGTREAAWLAAGGVVDMTHGLVDGTFKRGVALLRPPGHHAVPAASMGFCLLNNVAVAASAALAKGLKRVAIVDWDVHHGNGTQDMFYHDENVLFVSLHQFPFYPGTGAATETGRDAGLGYTGNLALPAESGPETYGAAFREVVLPMLQQYAPDLVLVSAGFDAHERDPLASMNLDRQTYGAFASSLLDLVDSLGHGRIGFVLEGGYDLYALSDSVQDVAGALLGKRTELPLGKLHAREREAIERTRQQLTPHWQLPLS